MFPLVGAMEYMHGYYGYQMQTYYNIYYMIIGNLIFTVFGYIFSLKSCASFGFSGIYLTRFLHQ